MPGPTIEDRTAIIDLMTRYVTCLDEGDVEGVVGCFTPDATLESPVIGSIRGLAEIRAFAERIAGHRHDLGIRYRHFISNFRIDVEGDAGRVRCYLLDYRTAGEKTELLSLGAYDCRLARTKDGWRITERRVEMDTPFKLP